MTSVIRKVQTDIIAIMFLFKKFADIVKPLFHCRHESESPAFLSPS
jgi:hypothetical protein